MTVMKEGDIAVPDPDAIIPVDTPEGSSASDCDDEVDTMSGWDYIPSQLAELADMYNVGYGPAATADAVVIPSPRSGGASFEATVTHAIVGYWGLSTPVGQQFDTRATVFYNIACAYAGRTWHVQRRFSDFVGLHEGLKRLVKSQKSVSGLPSLPGSCLFRRTNASRKRIEQRRNALAAYVANLLVSAQGNAGIRVQLASFLTATGFQPPLPPPPHEGYPGCPPTVVRSVFELPRSASLPGLALALPWAIGGGIDQRLLVVTPRVERMELARRRARDFKALLQWAATLGDALPSQEDVTAFLSYRLSQHRPSPHIFQDRLSRAEDAMLGYENAVLELPRRDHSSVRVCNFVKDGYDFPFSCDHPRSGVTVTITLDPPPCPDTPRSTMSADWDLRLPIPAPGHDGKASYSASCSCCSPTSSLGHWSEEVVCETGAAAACCAATAERAHATDQIGVYVY
eukprot:Hpha_TRINITY_DN13749_c0_g1::TRINITY_DN13749_c0_g1_i1::g.142592::m.142592